MWTSLTSRLLTFSAIVAICLSAPPTRATELLPGETITVSDLAPGTFNLDGSSQSGPFDYQQPNFGARRSYAFYNSIDSFIAHDLVGNPEIIYEFDTPQFGEHPPSPLDPIINLNPFPKDAIVSISGFGNGPVDATFITLTGYSSPMLSASIQRSPSGDVISFTGLPQTLPHFPLGDMVESIAFVVPGKSFDQSTATASLIDLEGNPRTLSTSAYGPIPEPASLLLFPLALTALALRLRRHAQN